MISVLAAVALAGPVLGEPVDPFAACRDASAAEAGVPDGWSDPAPSDRIAVVMGVPCHRDPAIPSLAYSSRDSARVADWLEGAGFEVVRLSTVVDREDVLKALDAAGRALAPDGTLLVYFSGHGVLREEAGRVRRYLILSDTTFADVPGTGLAVDELDQRIAWVEADHRVVVQDTCFAAQAGDGSKSLGQPVGTKGLAWLDPPPPPRRGDVHLYASRFWEQAVENPDYRASVYTHHLLDGLSGSADLDGDGCVGLKEAHAHARHAVTTERGGAQTPEIRTGFLDDLVLSCAGEPTRAVVQAPWEPGWRVHLGRSEGSVDPTGPAAVAPGRWKLEVEQLRGDVYTRLHGGPVLLKAGEWVDVEDLVERRAPIGLVALGGRWVGGDDLPAWAVSGTGWWASRDRGYGRAALGASFDVSPPGEAGVGCFRSSNVRGRVGWWAGGEGWAVGPVGGLGPIWRTGMQSCDGAALPTAMGAAGEAALHGHVALGAFGVGLDAGLEILPLAQRRTELVTSPMLRAVVGVAR